MRFTFRHIPLLCKSIAKHGYFLPVKIWHKSGNTVNFKCWPMRVEYFTGVVFGFKIAVNFKFLQMRVEHFTGVMFGFKTPASSEFWIQNHCFTRTSSDQWVFDILHQWCFYWVGKVKYISIQATYKNINYQLAARDRWKKWTRGNSNVYWVRP